MAIDPLFKQIYDLFPRNGKHLKRLSVAIPWGIVDELFGSSGNPDLDGVGTSKLTVPPTSSSSSPDTSHGFQQANFLSSLAGASSSR